MKFLLRGVAALGLLFSLHSLVAADAATEPALPPLPAPLSVPAPGPKTDAPYAPQAILSGGVVVKQTTMTVKGENLWIDTRESGTAALGTAGSGGRGATTGGALEGSNVDLAEEFVSMIQHQRSFSANSKTITTADEMLQELISIKR